jgi:hypothetical protein
MAVGRFTHRLSVRGLSYAAYRRAPEGPAPPPEPATLLGCVGRAAPPRRPPHGVPQTWFDRLTRPRAHAGHPRPGLPAADSAWPHHLQPSPPAVGRTVHGRARRPRRVFARRWACFGIAGPRTAWDDGRGQGHRTWLGAGSGCARPAPPACPQAWGQPSALRPGGGLPVARRRGLCPAGNGVLLTRGGAPRLTHALAQVQAGPPRGHAGAGQRGVGPGGPPPPVRRARRAPRRRVPEGRLHPGAACGPAARAADIGGQRPAPLPGAHRARGPGPPRGLSRVGFLGGHIVKDS